MNQVTCQYSEPPLPSVHGYSRQRVCIKLAQQTHIQRNSHLTQTTTSSTRIQKGWDAISYKGVFSSSIPPLLLSFPTPIMNTLVPFEQITLASCYQVQMSMWTRAHAEIIGFPWRLLNGPARKGTSAPNKLRARTCKPHTYMY